MERLKIVLVWLVSLGLGLTGCKQLQPVVTQTTTNERIVKVTETLRDTTVIIQPDTASVRAFLECDSLNQVVMRELEIVKGRKVTPIVKYVDGVLKINNPGTWFQFVIIIKDDNRLIGDIGVHFHASDTSQVEMGCTLNQEYHGKGFAFEALQSIINYLFDDLGKRRIIASIDSRNQASIRLIERLGFQKKAHVTENSILKSEWVDDLVYALLKDEWIPN